MNNIIEAIITIISPIWTIFKKIFLVILVVNIFYNTPYIIFPKNYNFLEKYILLCYTTSIERFGEKHETRDLIRTD